MVRLPGEIERVDTELGAAQMELANAIAAEKAWPDGLPGVDATRVAEAQARVDGVVVQRDALTALQATAGRAGHNLLLLDVNRDRPRAAVAVGDVDTADHVAVFTPGMDSDVAGDIGRYSDDMRLMRDVAGDELTRAGRGDETVAAVTWIGYEPPGGERGRGEPAAQPDPARRGRQEGRRKPGRVLPRVPQLMGT
jgi:hypothetical protein